MNKVQTVELIEDMKKLHESQMHKIELLLNSKEVDELTSVAKTECDFGKLLYKNEQHLKDILGALFFEKLEKLHERWHREYYNIYKIFKEYVDAKNAKKGFFSKIIGSKKITEMEIDKAKLYHSELKSTTTELIQTIDMCQRRVSALGNAKFE